MLEQLRELSESPYNGPHPICIVLPDDKNHLPKSLTPHTITASNTEEMMSSLEVYSQPVIHGNSVFQMRAMCRQDSGPRRQPWSILRTCDYTSNVAKETLSVVLQTLG